MAAPELGTRQFGSPRARPDCLHTLTPQLPPHSPRGPGRARAATAAAATLWGTRVPPRPALGPAPPGGCAGALPPPQGLPISLPHFVDGKTESLQQQFPNVIASKPDPGGLDTIQPLSAAA